MTPRSWNQVSKGRLLICLCWMLAHLLCPYTLLGWEGVITLIIAWISIELIGEWIDSISPT